MARRRPIVTTLDGDSPDRSTRTTTCAVDRAARSLWSLSVHPRLFPHATRKQNTANTSIFFSAPFASLSRFQSNKRSLTLHFLTHLRSSGQLNPQTDAGDGHVAALLSDVRLCFAVGPRPTMAGLIFCLTIQ